MSTPQGTRCVKVSLMAPGEAVHVYSDAERIVLQIRRAVPTEDDLMATSFKVGVALEPDEALRIAGELLTAAASRLKRRVDS